MVACWIVVMREIFLRLRVQLLIGFVFLFRWSIVAMAKSQEHNAIREQTNEVIWAAFFYLYLYLSRAQNTHAHRIQFD